MVEMVEGLTSPMPRPRLGVLLAAGRSERLAGVTGGGSKALIRVGGLTLVERAARTLLAAGVERVAVVVGYQAGPVAAVVDKLAPGRVRAAYAEHWEQGNGASLAAAEPLIGDEALFALSTADHVFGDGAFESLVTAGIPAVLVDRAPDPEAWAEGTRVRLHDERAVAFSKSLGDPSIDCGAFLLPSEVFDAHRRAAARGDSTLAGAVTELAKEQPLAAILLPPGGWWQDVDTAEDLRRARSRLRRSLAKEGDGPVSRYLNRPVSTRLSMALSPLRPHPDLVTVLVCLVGFLAAWLLGAGHALIGGVLVQVASVLDGVDGEVARLQLRAGPGGALLDGVLDRLVDAAIVAGLAVWAIDQGVGPELSVGLAVAATAGSMLSMATKDRIVALRLPSPPEHGLGYLLGGRDGRLLLIAVFAIASRPALALAAVAATSAISLLLRVVLTRFWVARMER